MDHDEDLGLDVQTAKVASDATIWYREYQQCRSTVTQMEQLKPRQLVPLSELLPLAV